MVTYAQFVDGTYKNPNAVRIHKGRIELHKAKVDFAYQSLTTDDVHQCLIIPPQTLVLNAWLNVLKACTSGTKCNLGYGSDTDYWGIELPLTTVGMVSQKFVDVEQGLVMIYGNRAPMANSPIYFANSDTIDVIAKGATTITKGVIEICALIFKTD